MVRDGNSSSIGDSALGNETPPFPPPVTVELCPHCAQVEVITLVPPNVAVFGDEALKEATEGRRGPVRREAQDGAHRGKDSLYKPRREARGGTNLADSSVADLQPPDCEMRFLGGQPLTMALCIGHPSGLVHR